MNYFIGEFLGSKIIIVAKTVIISSPFCDPGRPPMGSRGPSRLGFSNDLFLWGIPRFENNDRF